MVRRSPRVVPIVVALALIMGIMAAPAYAVAPPLALQQTFAEPGTASFGMSVALVTNAAVVGSAGKAVVYQKVHNTWSRLTELIPNPPTEASAANQYGYSVDISDKVAVVGAPATALSSGAVYVFTYSSTSNQWAYRQTLTPTVPVAGGRFGECVSVSDGTIVVGAPGNNSAANGSVYIFRPSDLTPWAQTDKLTGVRSFGYSVSIHYGTLVVGSPNEEGASGRARVYPVAADGTCPDEPAATLQQFNDAGAFVPQAGGRFGHSVTVRGTTVIVGAPAVQNGAFAFVKTGSVWTAQQQLVMPGWSAADGYGWSVALCNDTVLVGTNADHPKSGYAAYFVRTNNVWSYQSGVSLGEGKGEGDNYGSAVDLYCSVAAVGAPLDNAGAGTVYFHSTSEALPIYRFYNPKTGTHFYTDSQEERDYVWRELSRYFAYEGEAYKANPYNNDQRLHRFYNFKNGSHFYTASEDEKNSIIAKLSHTYTYDGPTYKVSTSPGAEGKTPVWRFYNARNGSHFYTASGTEKDYVLQSLAHTYRLEGICFYLGQ